MTLTLQLLWLQIATTPIYAQNTASQGAPLHNSTGIFARAFEGGAVVFLVLLCLICLSILCWAVVLSKYVRLKKTAQENASFIKVFWDSNSLNDLNLELDKHKDSSAKEVFKEGYTELLRSSQQKENIKYPEISFKASMQSIERSLRKSQIMQKKTMENYLPVLAICASAAPFIGLFGTVWGIMNAFEGIAQTGSASLAAVAPGISEALIATAFGLAAAIPAVIGYNIFQNMIRSQMIQLDGFSADFLNIVERYLVTETEDSNS